MTVKRVWQARDLGEVAQAHRAAPPRYHLLTWFLTMLVVMVFLREIGFDWLGRRYPAISGRFVQHPLSRRLAAGLAWLQKVSTKETT